MIEIGSEFSSNTNMYGNYEDSVYKFLIQKYSADNISFVNSGRLAISLILGSIKETKKKKALLPLYLCESIIDVFDSYQYDCEFYDPNSLTRVTLNKNSFDVILLIDYFGFTDGVVSSENAFSAFGKKQGSIVIRDVTHSVFMRSSTISSHSYVDFEVCSLRKWFAIYSGGYVATLNPLFSGFQQNIELPKNDKFVDNRALAMKMKGAAEYQINKSKVLDLLKVAESHLTEMQITSIDEHSLYELKKISVVNLRRARTINAKILVAGIKKIDGLNLMYENFRADDVPLFVPVIVDENLKYSLKKYLANELIYLPSHWPIPMTYKSLLSKNRVYYKEISFVCDQRYSENEMFQVLDKVKQFLCQNINS